MQRLGTRVLVAVVLVAAAIQFVPAGRSNPESDPALEIRGPITTILSRSCFDCHSHHTLWPWYSRIAPISWLVRHDVAEGREKLNFSLWGEYSLTDRQHLSAKASEEVQHGEMPLPMYLWLHPAARLSQSDRGRLETWSQSLQGEPGAGRSSGADTGT